MARLIGKFVGSLCCGIGVPAGVAVLVAVETAAWVAPARGAVAVAVGTLPPLAEPPGALVGVAVGFGALRVGGGVEVGAAVGGVPPPIGYDPDSTVIPKFSTQDVPVWPTPMTV